MVQCLFYFGLSRSMLYYQYWVLKNAPRVLKIPNIKYEYQVQCVVFHQLFEQTIYFCSLLHIHSFTGTFIYQNWHGRFIFNIALATSSHEELLFRTERPGFLAHFRGAAASFILSCSLLCRRAVSTNIFYFFHLIKQQRVEIMSLSDLIATILPFHIVLFHSRWTI